MILISLLFVLLKTVFSQGFNGWSGMSKLLDLGYVSEVGGRYWLTRRGLKVALLLDDTDDPPCQRAGGRASIAPPQVVYYSLRCSNDF